MPDINDKYVIYYATKGYGSSLTVTISIYDTVGSTEINAQSMTELGSTGIYYFNFYPRKRTSYTAVMNCTERPYQSHQIIRVEKLKVVGAVTMPKIPLPKFWTRDDKVRLFKKLELMNKDLNNDKVLREISLAVGEAEVEQQSIQKHMANLDERGEKIFRDICREVRIKNAELAKNAGNLSTSVDNKFSELSTSLQSFKGDIKNNFASLSEEIEDKFSKMASSVVIEKIDGLSKISINLAQASDDLSQLLKVTSSSLNSKYIIKKLETLSRNIDEFRIILKNEK